MSLGYVFVKCDDGKYYRDGTLGTSEWFLCFDEDEDPELVIKAGAYKNGLTPEKIIEGIGLKAKVISKVMHFAGRCFSGDSKRGGLKMSEAVAVYLRIFAPPPAEWIKRADAIYDTYPKMEGTYWTFENVEDIPPRARNRY